MVSDLLRSWEVRVRTRMCVGESAMRNEIKNMFMATLGTGLKVERAGDDVYLNVYFYR